MLNVVILGASNNPDRYAHMAQRMLLENGHRVFPVNPKEREIAGMQAYPSLSDISEAVDVVTLYINPEHLTPLLPELLALKPARAIFNPGSESPVIEKQLQAHSIKTERACTLVLLRTGQFESG